MQDTPEAFQSCLKTWSIFLGHLTDRADDRKRAAATAAASAPAAELAELRSADNLPTSV
jgi:hypothetical protein